MQQKTICLSLLSKYSYLFIIWNEKNRCSKNISHILSFLGGSAGKESTSSSGDLGLIPGSWRSPEKGMTTHSSILPWRIPWTEEPCGLQSMGLLRVGHNWLTHTKVKVKVAQLCLTLCNPWNSPGQNTAVGNLSLLQVIFPTRGSNPGLPHCRQILYQLSQKGSPSILEWVAYPFSNRSSWPRNQTRVSCTAGRFFTNWAIRDTHWGTY